MSPDRKTVWNAVLTAAAVAVFGWMGWISMSIIELQRHTTNRFTDTDAASLRADITDVTTDIDKRLSLNEHDVEWVKTIMLSAHGLEDNHTFDNVGNALPPLNNEPGPASPYTPVPEPPQPAPDPEQPQQQLRKYDLRGKK